MKWLSMILSLLGLKRSSQKRNMEASRRTIPAAEAKAMHDAKKGIKPEQPVEAGPMRINQEGLELIKNFEGLELKAYQDVVGVWTIGYGSTGDHVKPGLKITEKEAEELLMQDLERFEDGVSRIVDVDLNSNQFSALVSFTFNLGVGALEKSTLLRKLNSGDYKGAANEFERWVFAGGKKLAGLKRRRKAEKALFLK